MWEKKIAADPRGWKENLQSSTYVTYGHMHITFGLWANPPLYTQDHQGKEDIAVPKFICQVREPGFPTGIN
jgi:hypothetical protein